MNKDRTFTNVIIPTRLVDQFERDSVNVSGAEYMDFLNYMDLVEKETGCRASYLRRGPDKQHEFFGTIPSYYTVSAVYGLLLCKWHVAQLLERVKYM